jgi:hypothetical protein
LRRGNLLDQCRFLHGLDVPTVFYKFLARQAKKKHTFPKGKLDLLFLIVGMVAGPQFAPKVVECDLSGRMLTDPAVPRCAVARTLGARIRLDSLLFVRLAFLPAFGGLEHLARCRNDLLIRRQFYVINVSRLSFFVDRPTGDRPSSRSSRSIVNLKPAEDIGDSGKNGYHIPVRTFFLSQVVTRETRDQAMSLETNPGALPRNHVVL